MNITSIVASSLLAIFTTSVSAATPFAPSPGECSVGTVSTSTKAGIRQTLPAIVALDRKRVARVTLGDGSTIAFSYDGNGALKGLSVDDKLKAKVEREAERAIGLRMPDGRLRLLPTSFTMGYAGLMERALGTARPKWDGGPDFGNQYPYYDMDEYWYQAFDSWEDWDGEYFESPQYWNDYNFGANTAACIRTCSAIGMAWARACFLAGPLALECLAAAEAFTLACTLICEARYP